MLSSRSLPVTRYCAVDSGTSTSSLGFCMPTEPLSSRMPITVNGTPPSSTLCPSSAPAVVSSFAGTSLPSTATRRRASSSCGTNILPAAIS